MIGNGTIFLIWAKKKDGGNSLLVRDHIEIRVEEYRGGADPLDYGMRNARRDEVFVNSVQFGDKE